MKDLFYLHAAGSGEATPFLTLGTALPKQRNGLDCFYYWRQAACDGDYTHPVKGFKFPVTADRRKGWEDRFRQMSSAGIEVPVVKDHQETSDATLGYVVDVRQNGSWYEELHQYLGEDAKTTALRNKLSVGVDPDFKDGKGKKWGDVIVHSATTPRPVIGGQGDAVPLAASAAGNGADVLTLAAPEQGDSMPVTPEQHKKILELMGKGGKATDHITPENATDHLISYCDGLGSKYLMSMSKEEAEAKLAELSAAGEKIKTLEADVAEKAKAIQTLSAAPADAPNAATLKLVARGLETLKMSAIAAGALTPAVAKKVADLLVGPAEAPNRHTLCMGQGDADPLAYQVFAALAENKPVALGAKSGVQALSRAVPGEEEPANKDVNPLLETAKTMYPQEK